MTTTKRIYPAVPNVAFLRIVAGYARRKNQSYVTLHDQWTALQDYCMFAYLLN